MVPIRLTVFDKLFSGSPSNAEHFLGVHPTSKGNFSNDFLKRFLELFRTPKENILMFLKLPFLTCEILKEYTFHKLLKTIEEHKVICYIIFAS